MTCATPSVPAPSLATVLAIAGRRSPRAEVRTAVRALRPRRPRRAAASTAAAHARPHGQARPHRGPGAQLRPATDPPEPTRHPVGGTTDTDWGAILDVVPDGFPVYPRRGPPRASTSRRAAGGWPTAGVDEVATWYRDALEELGFTVGISPSPLEDGSRVLDMQSDLPGVPPPADLPSGGRIDDDHGARTAPAVPAVRADQQQGDRSGWSPRRATSSGRGLLVLTCWFVVLHRGARLPA